MEENFDVDKFISLIKARESIWNYKGKAYANKVQRKEDWMSVCAAMVDDFDTKSSTEKSDIVLEYQSKWKVLRNGFTRSIKNFKMKSGKDGHTSKLYTYYSQMKFLNDLYDHNELLMEAGHSAAASANKEYKRRKRSRRTSSGTSSEDNESLQSIAAQCDKPNNNYSHKVHRNTNDIEFDEDKHFLMSLLSDFKKIPSDQKLDAKGDIINVIRHYRKTSAAQLQTGVGYFGNDITSLATTAIQRTNSCSTNYCENIESFDDNSSVEMKFITDS